MFSTETLNMKGTLRAGAYELGISISAAPSPADSTKVVTIAPRYVIRSLLTTALAVRQCGQGEVTTLEPSEEVQFNWSHYKGEHLIQLALKTQAGGLGPFTGGLRIDEVGETMLVCGEAECALDVIYERQRRANGLSDFSAASLRPSDLGEWCDERMENALTRGPGGVALPPLWEWVESAWHWDHPTPDERAMDGEGWEYAVDWDAPFWPRVYVHAMVRRRRWVRLRRPNLRREGGEGRSVVVDVSMRGPSVLVTILEGKKRPPPYILDNTSSEALHFNQKGVPLRRRSLPAGQRMHFCWDQPAGRRVLELSGAGKTRPASRGGQLSVEVRLDEVGERAPLRWGNKKLLLSVRAQGNTRTLTISDWKEGEGRKEEEETFLHLLVEMNGVGLSIVRSGLREIAFLRISDVSAELSASSLANRVALHVGELRIDNQAHDAQLPAVLIRTSIANRQHVLMDADAKKVALSPPFLACS